MTTQTHRARVRGLQAVAIALLVLPLLVAASDRYALVIGNGKYEHIDPLPNPPNDVKLVADALRKVGFEVELLVDASQRQMDEATMKFAKSLDEAGKNAVGVFYYAGHGVTYDGENWLVPVSAKIASGPDIRYNTLSANKVLRLMEDARNATDILILDACRDSPFRGFSLSGTRSVSRGMSKMEAPAGSFIAYSTAPGKVAYDGRGQYSPFAEAFAAEVTAPGVSIGDMMIEVRKKVKASTKGLGPSPQTPWDSSSLSGRFAFVPGGQSPRIQQQAVLPQPIPQQRSGQTADTRMWASIEKSTDPAEFDVYLKRFPDGQYADLAKIRRDRLKNKPKPVQKTAAKPVTPPGSSAMSGGASAAGAGSDESGNAALCRQFAGGDAELFMECMEEADIGMADNRGVSGAGSATMPPAGAGAGAQPGAQSAVWYDDYYNVWQVSIMGNSVSASANIPGAGPLQLRGQVQGYGLTFGIFDANGQQIGYGEATMTDQTHISYSSFYANGAFMGSGQFHVNHPPN